MQVRQRLGEQFDLAPDGDIAGSSGRHDGSQFAIRGQARADRDKVDAIEQVGAKFAGDELRIWRGRAQRRQALRFRARIGHAHACAAPREPVRHREPGFTEAQYQCEFAVVVH